MTTPITRLMRNTRLARRRGARLARRRGARLARRRGARAGLLVAVPLVAVATLAAGCGTAATRTSGGAATRTSGGAATRTSGGAATSSPGAASGTAAPAAGPTPVPTTTGGPVTPGQPACAGWPATVPHGPLPASFVPVAAMRCVTSDQTIPGKGEWLTATLERADKNLGPLVTALRQPSDHAAPGVICPAIAMVPPQFVLVSGDGKMIMPRLPLSGCGLVQRPVLAALAALSWQKVSVRLVSPVQTQQETASGCAPQDSDPFTAYGSLRPSAGGPVFGTSPASLRICVYGSGAAGSAPRFLRAATVAGTAERELITGLSGAGRVTVCSLPRSAFAVIGGPGSPLIYVELGGCYRVLRYEAVAGRLMRLSVGQATPGAVAVIKSVTHSGP
jgi:hypothetical protein